MKSFIISSKNLFDQKLNPHLKLTADFAEANVPKTDEVMCSLCKAAFKKQDPDLKIRMQRHEARHNRGRNCRSQKHGGGNNVIGKVEWIQG